MEEISKQEYEEFFKWLFGEDVEIKQELDIGMAPYYNDPNIYYTKEIYDLFQTKAMQRLGKITHLGAFIVIDKNIYHTRLEHSKGAYRRCIEFLTIQYKDPKWREYIEENRQKGYLVDTIKFMCTHDVGHSMLSHSMEKIIGNNECTHEDIGEKIRKQDNELNSALEKIKPNEEKSNQGDGSLDSLCEGNIDFDRFDYLSRDYLYLGDQERNINDIIKRLASSCKLEKLENGKMAYVYNCETMKYIEQFLLIRKEAYKNIMEKNKMKSEHFFRNIISKIIELDNDSDVKQLFSGLYNKSIDDINIEDVLETNDMKLFNALISLKEDSKDEELIGLIDTIIPDGENAFQLAVNMIDPKNRDKNEYEEEEREFINNIRKLISEKRKENDISNHIIAFEAENNEIIDKLPNNPAIERYKKRFRIYNPNVPIYVKDRNGHMVKFEEHPDLSIKLENEYRYGVFLSIDELKRQGKTPKEIDCIVGKVAQYNNEENSIKIKNSDNKRDISKNFENFFEER